MIVKKILSYFPKIVSPKGGPFINYGFGESANDVSWNWGKTTTATVPIIYMIKHEMVFHF